jgi:hypothetical protein
MEILDCDQNSDEWMLARCGIVTASQMKTVLANGKGGGESVTRRKYLYQLAGEILTGEPAETFSNHHMQRGHDLEDEARNYYALVTDNRPARVGFIRNGKKGCSPDSLVGDAGILEIKTALPSILIDLIFRDQFPPEHKAQTQGQLWIAEREWIDLIVYWRGIPAFIKRATRNEPYIENLSGEVDRFNDELESIVAKLRSYGGHDAIGEEAA